MNQRVDQSEVDRLRAVLEQAPERAPKVTRGEAIRMLAPQLRELKERGYTVDDIVTLLRGHGWNVAVDTVRACLGGKRGKRPRGAVPPTSPGQAPRPPAVAGAATPRPPKAEGTGTASGSGPMATANPPGRPTATSVPTPGAVRAGHGKEPATGRPPDPPKSTFKPREDTDEI